VNYTNSTTRLAPPARPTKATPANVLTIIRDARGVHLRLRRAATVARRGLRRAVACCALLTAALAASAEAQNYSFNATAPALDKWVYPFASSGGGTRTSAPLFGAIGGTAGQFDDRNAQFFVGFNTSATVPAGRGAASYLISSATLQLSLSASVADLVVFDGSYDPISSYAADGSALGGDAGRPVELYGAGYRNGFTALRVTETTGFSFGDPAIESTRNIFATDHASGTARDVSNNFRDAFDAAPFAIGQIAPADLNPDGTIKEGVVMTFTLNLANPDVLSYLQAALNAGRINLLATSLHPAAQGGPANRPEFDTKEMGLAGTPAALSLQVSVVPEPCAASLAILGAAFIAGWRQRRVLLGKEDPS